MENTETRQLKTFVARATLGDALERLNAVLAHVGRQIADASSQFTIVTGLESLCRDVDPAVQARLESILAEIISVLPETFGKADPAALSRLYGCQFQQLFPVAARHLKDPGLEGVHLRFTRIWKRLSNKREREFAQRCAIVLVESIRLHRESGQDLRPHERPN